MTTIVCYGLCVVVLSLIIQFLSSKLMSITNFDVRKDKCILNCLENQIFADSDLLTTVSQLCASSVATVMLGSSLQGVCQSRLCLCRDVLIVLCSLGLSEKTQVCEGCVRCEG